MLTAVQVRDAKTQEKPYKLTDSKGLYLHVIVNGTKAWRYRYRFAGKESTITLGSYPQMSLKQARDARVATRFILDEGKSPADERKKQKQQKQRKALERQTPAKDTVEYVALEWIEQQKERWSPGHAKEVLGTLERDVFPSIGNHSVDAIAPQMVLSILRNIKNRGALEIARKVLQRTNAVLRYAVQTGRATYNPAADMQGGA